MDQFGHSFFLSAALWEFRSVGLHTDVTLVCEDGQLEAHSALLANLLTRLRVQGREASECILLQGLQVKQVEKALEKIYLKQDLSMLWEILNMYQEHDAKLIKGLEEISEKPLNKVVVKIEPEPGGYDDDLEGFVPPLESEFAKTKGVKEEDYNLNFNHNYNLKTPYVLLKNCYEGKSSELPVEILHMLSIKKEEIGCGKAAYEKEMRQHLGNCGHQLELKYSPWTECQSNIYGYKLVETLGGKDKFTCEYCGFEADCQIRLANHVMYLHEKKETPLNRAEETKCNETNTEGKAEEELSFLLSSIKGRWDSKSCDMCDFQTKYKVDMIKHVKTVHEHRKTFKKIKRSCTSCDFQTFSKDKLRRHIISNHGGLSYDCNLCDYKSLRPDCLSLHIKVTHEGLRYYCDQCSFSGTSRKTVQRHLRTVHFGEKFQCDKCDKQFSMKRGLEEHVEAKHEGRKFICDQCDLQFNGKANLLCHVKIKHEGFRYSCEHCNYQATTRRTLRFHMQANHEHSPSLNAGQNLRT